MDQDGYREMLADAVDRLLSINTDNREIISELEDEIETFYKEGHYPLIKGVQEELFKYQNQHLKLVQLENDLWRFFSTRDVKE